MTIYNFAKCNGNEQEELIQSQGVFLDNWNENEHLINLYYLDGFFVEVTLSLFHNDPVEIMPFRRGYNIRNYRKQLMTRYKHVLDTIQTAA